MPFNRIHELCKLVGVEYDQDSMTREAPCPSAWCTRTRVRRAKMARVAFEDAIAVLDNVAEVSYKDPTMFRQYSVSDLSLVQMMAPKVEHESVLRGVQHCSSTSTCCSHSC